VILPPVEGVAPALRDHIIEVLQRAARTLEANIAVFLDVQGHGQPPPPSVYGHTFVTGDPAFPAFDLALAHIDPDVPFATRIWLAQAVLQGSEPTVLLTQTLAHELGHAHQIEQHRKLYHIWTHYEHFFLGERGSHLKPWERPLDIEAELFARRIVRHFHPGADLAELARRSADAGCGAVLLKAIDDELGLNRLAALHPRRGRWLGVRSHGRTSYVRPVCSWHEP
jgi:hypothetical protein